MPLNMAGSTVEYLSRIFPGSFSKAAATLIGGTAASQLVAIATLPLITRLYSPSEFGVLAVFVALTSVIATAASLRLELAIPLPEDDVAGADLLAAALLCSAAVTFAVTFALLLISSAFSSAVCIGPIGSFVWLVPIGILVTSSFIIFQNWSTRRHRFGLVSVSKVGQTVMGLGTQLGLGLLGYGPIGLLSGYVVTSGAGGFALAMNAIRRDWHLLRQITTRGILRQLRDYRRFPQYTTIESLANTAGNQVPLLIVALTAASAEAGVLLLAARAVATPVQIIGGGIAQVFLTRAPSAFRSNTLQRLCRDITIRVMILGAPALVLGAMMAPQLFDLLFGTEWRRAGELLQWMTPWLILQFIAFPISQTFYITNRHRLALVLQLFGCVLRIGAVVYAAVAWRAFQAEAFAVASAIFYLIQLAILWHVIARHPDMDFRVS